MNKENYISMLEDAMMEVVRFAFQQYRERLNGDDTAQDSRDIINQGVATIMKKLEAFEQIAEDFE